MLLALAVDRAADEPGAEAGAAPDFQPAPLEDGALGGDQLALVAAALEVALERPHDADVGVAGALAAALLADLEEGVDPAIVGRVG